MWVREVAWPRRGAHNARQPGITPVPRTRAASRARPRHCSFVSYYYCISVIDLIISPVICLGEEELKSVVAAFDSKSNAGGGGRGGGRGDVGELVGCGRLCGVCIIWVVETRLLFLVQPSHGCVSTGLYV